jgi:uncharacterized protein involved in exopolysaccharide biosynthesis
MADPILILVNEATRFYFRIFEVLLRKLGVALNIDLPLGDEFSRSGSRDGRIAKIDEARTNLEDALSALGELKSEAEANKAELQDALRRLDEAKAGHAAETEQLVQIRAIAEADIAAFRRMAGINPARERLIGFLGGVAASLIAAGLWKLAEAIFT